MTDRIHVSYFSDVLCVWAYVSQVRVDELQRHFDPVGVGLVENELRVPLERLGFGVERTRIGRVRDLLHTDNNFHSRAFCQSGVRMPRRANQIV